ncbi:MAG: D-lyxose/D-mannose family sugar isomerase [Oscillospiraceae bacterium]|nr:D-lyxose/D-mannose family sugar isomerase [Oscillospiraceae bacterium]
MKRSQINAAIKKMEALAKKHGFLLPPFCHWSPETWQNKDNTYNEIRETKLGWDVTDYGKGRFETTGFTLITIRNGILNHTQYNKPYAEKLLMLAEGQYAPMHFHWYKMEDIINRGGGTVLITVYNSTPEETFADTPVTVLMDGHSRTVSPGTEVRLAPGTSITIPPYLYHDFRVMPGTGDVLLGEVSMCNDDENDNRFYEQIGRFPKIEEDEAPYRLLCTEYPSAGT